MARADSQLALSMVPTWLGIGLMRACATLPYSWLLALGRRLGHLAERLAARRREIVDQNFTLCFPEMSDAQRLQLRHRHFESVGIGVLEFAMAWWWSDRRLLPLTEVEGKQHLEAAMREGKGIILLSAHSTSLEIGGRILHSLLPIHAMYRPNENPVLQRFIEGNRTRHVAGVIPRTKPKEMMRVLRKGGAVWFAPDQDYGGKGHVFVDFFGVPAATNPATARFAGATDAVVIPVIVLRKPDGGYRLLFEPVFDDFPSDDVLRDTRRVNAVFEKWALQAPEQYFWLHRRFKHRPPGADPVYASVRSRRK